MHDEKVRSIREQYMQKLLFSLHIHRNRYWPIPARAKINPDRGTIVENLYRIVYPIYRVQY